MSESSDISKTTSWVVFLISLAASAFVVGLAGFFYQGWGFLASIFLVLLTAEHYRRTWSLGSTVRYGVTLGLVIGWGTTRIIQLAS